MSVAQYWAVSTRKSVSCELVVSQVTKVGYVALPLCEAAVLYDLHYKAIYLAYSCTGVLCYTNGNVLCSLSHNG